MSEMQSFEGGCHCGKVRYRASADLSSVVECNCSHCSAKGLLLTFTPIENFELTAGMDALTEYTFNKHVIRHQFCSTCGVQPFARGKALNGAEMAAINARCIDGIDVATLNRHPVDGRSA